MQMQFFCKEIRSRRVYKYKKEKESLGGVAVKNEINLIDDEYKRPTAER